MHVYITWNEWKVDRDFTCQIVSRTNVEGKPRSWENLPRRHDTSQQRRNMASLAADKLRDGHTKNQEPHVAVRQFGVARVPRNARLPNENSSSGSHVKRDHNEKQVSSRD